MLVTALEASSDVPKLEIFTERLLHEESKRKDKETTSTEVKAITSKHRTTRRGPKCHNCGKIGHIRKECRLLSERFGKGHDLQSMNNMTQKSSTRQKAYAVEQNTDDEEEDIIGLVAEHTVTTKRQSNWVVDSGATCHMCKDEELFDQVSVLHTPQEITVGDGYSVQATGKGNVILEMNLPNGKIGQCRLTDVLFVPDLSHNLLSVSKAASNGKTFEFVQSSCNIIAAKYGVVATATKYGNVYYLDCIGFSVYMAENQAVMKCGGSEETNDSIWHRRFGHLGARTLERILA